MIYSNLYFKKDAKIPFGIIVLIVFIFSIVLVKVMMKSPQPSNKVKRSVKRMEITNLSSNQATIFFLTDNKEEGYAVYGDREDRLDKIAFDERDLQTNKSKYFYHYIILRDLRENQKYFFKMMAANQIIGVNGIETFSFKTPMQHANPNNLAPAYGKLVKSNGSPQEGALVLLQIDNSFPISSLSKATGEWLIPLNNFYGKNDLQIITPSLKENIKLEILSEDGESSSIITDLTKLVPQTVVLGKNYDFVAESEVLGESDTQQKPLEKKDFDIIYPKENALVPGNNPLIKGLSLPNMEVIVTIKTNESISSRVKSDKDGVWKYALPFNLPFGQHEITAVTKNAKGQEVKIQRKFTIAKNGEQILGEATAEPTLMQEPTIEPTTIPTAVLPTAYEEVTVTPTEPVSGGNFSIFMLTSASLIVAGLGILLAF